MVPIGTELGSMQCININIMDDEELENTEQFTLQLASLSPRSVQINPNFNTSIINVLDNERMSLLKSTFFNSCALINTYSTSFSIYTKVWVCVGGSEC